MPARSNSAKGDSMGPRQREIAKNFHKAGLITQARLDKILKRTGKK